MQKKHKIVLIIEEESSMNVPLKENLEGEGFDVTVAVNGKEGLEMALNEHPDLILLDILLPEMDGVTVLKKLREDEWGKNVKVIVLSNLSDSNTVANAIEEGSFGYLVKTEWKIEDVVAKAREILKR